MNVHSNPTKYNSNHMTLSSTRPDIIPSPPVHNRDKELVNFKVKSVHHQGIAKVSVNKEIKEKEKKKKKKLRKKQCQPYRK
jgi:predicted FMN-binding regulatory protein PaiB